MSEKNNDQNKRIDLLRQRVKRCVCKYCGRKLQLRQIMFTNFEDARTEIFCSECDRIEFGVEKEIYNSAKFFVENSRFNCYPDLDDSENTKQMTIAKVCEIMAWENQNLGFLNSDGFTVPIHANENFIGECVTLSDDDLADE